MKKTLLLWGFVLFLLNVSYAQKQLLSIEDAVLKQRTTLAPEKLQQLAWIPGINSYSFIEKTSDTEQLVAVDAPSAKKSVIITLGAINYAVTHGKDSIKTLQKFPTIKWLDTQSFYFIAENKVFRTNTQDKSTVLLNEYPKEVENVDIEEHDFKIAYTIGNNLFMKVPGEKPRQITNETDRGIVCGQAVHRNEFGIKKGTFWSPDGSLLAYYRMDERMVTDYPIYDLSMRPAQAKMIKYPMAGQKSHEVTVGIYNVGANTSIFLATGEPAEQYLTNITWHPTGRDLFVAVVNRAQNEMKLNVYDSDNGNFKSTVLVEKSDKYLEPEHGPVFLRKTPTRFIWQSKRDGFNHLYLYDIKAGLLSQVTKGKWMVTDLLGFNPAGDKVFYISTQDSPTERHAYCYDFLKFKNIKLTNVAGTHVFQINSTYTYSLDTYTSSSIPRNTDLKDLYGRKIRNVLTAENPLKDYKMGRMKLFTLKNNGIDLHCRLILPANYDSTKKYPVLDYLYGGSHAQLVTNSWLGGADMWLHYMAQQGYVVFTLDNRGSSFRGEAFEQATFRQLGKLETEDQLVGIKYLKSLPYVDTTRMGLYGWSFGGFMTTTMMTKHPDIFKAAVAGGPVMDWNLYEVMYTERYMDTPQENPEGYANANLLDKAPNLKGHLMLIHGSLDDVVIWQHSLLFIQQCVQKGIPIDYFVYPEHKHNVLGPDRVHLMSKITDYFNLYLKK